MAIAIITGASSGLGKDFATQISALQNVDELWLIARRKQRLEDLASAISKPCRVFSVDLASEDGLKEYKNILQENKPQVNYLVNAAGFGKYGSYKVVDTEIAFKMIDLNVKALLFITQETLPYMGKGSHIIQMGSASTYHPLPNLNVYASTKSFVRHYSYALAYELADRGISVTTVCPGWVKTEFFDNANIDSTSDKSFTHPMVLSSDVVKKAIRDANRGKKLSQYAAFNRLHSALARVLPRGFMIALWNNMQKRAK